MKAILLRSKVRTSFSLVLFSLLIAVHLQAQDYVINRGVFSGWYTGSMRMCVVDKNEYYAPYTASSKLVVRRYKNGAMTNWGTNTSFPNMGGMSDIARDPFGNVIYIAFFNAAYNQICTYMRGPSDNDWVAVNTLDQPGPYVMGYTLRLAFNESSQTLFMGFSEQTSGKVYLYELIAGVWTNRTGASSMLCDNSRFDLSCYGNKVIVTTGSMGTLKVHVYDVSSPGITNLNQNISNVAGFATTAYDSTSNTYVSFFGQSAPWMGLKVVKSVGGANWTDMSGTLSGAMDNGSWGGYIVYNKLTAKFTLVYSSGTLKGYSWNGSDWVNISIPYMQSTNTFAIPNYKDVYFLAWSGDTPVGIYSTNETPVRNTTSITSSPNTTSCILHFPVRGDGYKVAVFVKKADSYDAPVVANGTSYTANASFGSGTQLGSSGWYCVYNDVGETVNITALTSNATYQVQAFEYNGNAGQEMYAPVTAVTGNPVSFVASVTLPLNWISFTAKPNAGQVLLTWRTASEKNTASFEIQRSQNGTAFNMIGQTEVSSAAAAEHTYQFTDTRPLSGDAFYRIRQTDLDGRASYSPVIRIADVSKSDFRVWADPANGSIHAVIPEDRAGTTVLNLFNTAGGRLFSKQLDAASNIVDAAAIGHGTFIVQILQNGMTVYTGKIIK